MRPWPHIPSGHVLPRVVNRCRSGVWRRIEQGRGPIRTGWPRILPHC